MDRKNVEAIYPLSPSQRGMLFETLRTQDAGLHFEQSAWLLQGHLNIDVLGRAWQETVNRHTLLRTGFVWKDQDEPLQVVLRQVEVSLEHFDWRGIASTEQQKQLNEYIDAARQRGFELARPPLMRPVLFQLDEATYELIWTSHHILMDAWSKPILYQELFEIYQAFCKDQAPQLEPRRPYKDYISWLQSQDLSQAEIFWRKQLQGFTQPTPLGCNVSPTPDSERQERYGEQSAHLSESATVALQSIAKQRHVTLNTLVQGVWTLLLSRYSGEEDVVFGITVSGRPAALAGSESMLGLFINTVPVRLKVNPEASLWNWLATIQSYNAELRRYDYISSGQIHQWSDMPGALPLYQSLVVFENLSNVSSVPYLSGLTVERNRRRIRFEATPTNYPLTLLAFPGSQLRFQLLYDGRRLDGVDVTQALEHFGGLFNKITDEPEIDLRTLLNQIPANQIPEIKSLQGFTEQGVESEIIAPRNEIEEKLAYIWQTLLGIEPIGIYDNFLELGGHSLLLTQLLNRLHTTFKADISLRNLFENPTIAAMSELIIEKIASQEASVGKEKPIVERLSETFPTERLDVLEEYLKQKVSHALNIDISQFSVYKSLQKIDLESISEALIWNFKQDLSLPVYPHEILRMSSIRDLAQFILTELDRMSGKQLKPIKISFDDFFGPPEQRPVSKRTFQKPVKKNKSMIFLLSGPDSGSTLLRDMLAGHPALFCPPELGILAVESTSEIHRDRISLGLKKGSQWEYQGLQMVFSELMNVNSDESKALVQKLIEQDVPTQKVYEMLQQQADKRLLVDKNSVYSLRMQTLQRVETQFEGAKYIHLLCHPYTAIESFVRNRLYALYSLENVDPYEFTEAIWVRSNSNLLQLGQQLAPDRYYLIHYEELVSKPVYVMRNLCEFLGISFDEEILSPYDGKRMIERLGDPDILQHKTIDSSLSEAWKSIRLPQLLGEEARQLAARLKYELPAEAETISEEPLVAKLDQLSDGEVHSLLSQVLAEEEGRA